MMNSLVEDEAIGKNPAGTQRMMIYMGSSHIVITLMLGLRMYFSYAIDAVSVRLASGELLEVDTSVAGAEGALAARLVYGLQSSALAFLFLAIMVVAVACGRVYSRANNPFAGRESRITLINLRVLQNTVEQCILFAVANTVTALYLPTGRLMTICPIATGLFLYNRFIFWFGYLKGPKWRACGMAGGGFVTSMLCLYSWWCLVADVISGSYLVL